MYRNRQARGVDDGALDRGVRLPRGSLELVDEVPELLARRLGDALRESRLGVRDGDLQDDGLGHDGRVDLLGEVGRLHVEAEVVDDPLGELAAVDQVCVRRNPLRGEQAALVRRRRRLVRGREEQPGLRLIERGGVERDGGRDAGHDEHARDDQHPSSPNHAQVVAQFHRASLRRVRPRRVVAQPTLTGHSGAARPVPHPPSVHQRLGALGERLLDERSRPCQPYAGTGPRLGDATPCRALGAQGHRPALEHRGQQVRGGGRVLQPQVRAPVRGGEPRGLPGQPQRHRRAGRHPGRGHGQRLVRPLRVVRAAGHLDHESARHPRRLDSLSMEALFITMMALVVLLTGFVSLLVLWRLFKADNNSGHQADHI